jgi:hypothetical protein
MVRVAADEPLMCKGVCMMPERKEPQVYVVVRPRHESADDLVLVHPGAYATEDAAFAVVPRNPNDGSVRKPYFMTAIDSKSPLWVRLVGYRRDHESVPRARRVIWDNDPRLQSHPEHYLAVSENRSEMVSYYPNEYKFLLGKRTRCRPGRYLKQFYGDVLSDNEINKLADQQRLTSLQSGMEGNVEFGLARTESEIVWAYRTGPYSCMRDFSESDHPCRVYAAGDLAIAYLKHKHTGKVVARALCWPENHVYGRVYPTQDYWDSDGFESADEARLVSDMLVKELAAHEFSFDGTHGCGFDGAKLQCIEKHSEFVMPYLDYGYRVSRDGSHFIMDRSGEYEADSTSGYIEPEDRVYAYCERCDNECDEDATYEVVTEVDHRGRQARTENWCYSCAANHTWVWRIDRISDDVECVEVDGENTPLCVAENEASHVDYPRDEWTQSPVVTAHVGGRDVTVTEDYAEESLTRCAVSGEYFDPETDAHSLSREVWEGVPDEDAQAWLDGQSTGRVGGSAGRIEDNMQQEIEGVR